jgi:hypothetical protein
MRRMVSPSLRCAAAASLAFALGCGMIDRLTGVADARDLHASGVAAEAEVLSLWDTGITVNHDPVIGLRVEVRPVDGPPYQATIAKSLVSRLDVPRFQPGQVVPVRVDPRNPARVAIDVYGEGAAAADRAAAKARPSGEPRSGDRSRDEAPRSAAGVQEIKDWVEKGKGFGRPNYLHADLAGLAEVFVAWNIPTSGVSLTYYWIYCRRGASWTLLEAASFQPTDDQTRYAFVDPFAREVRFVGPHRKLFKTVSVAACQE